LKKKRETERKEKEKEPLFGVCMPRITRFRKRDGKRRGGIESNP
jgi:hypothetical protein